MSLTIRSREAKGNPIMDIIHPGSSSPELLWSLLTSMASNGETAIVTEMKEADLEEMYDDGPDNKEGPCS